MSAKQSLTSFSDGLGIATVVVFGLSILGFLTGGDAGQAAILFILAILMACLWGALNMVGRVAGFGTVDGWEKKKAQRIAEYEKQNGLSPVGWQIPWFGGRKLGCDIHGMFMEERNGTRRRDV